MINVNLKCVKAEHIHILEKSKASLMNPNPRYSLRIIIPPTHKDLYSIRKAIELEASRLDKPFKSPLKKGGSDLNNLSMFAKSDKQPIILNTDGDIADIEQQVKGFKDGGYFDISVSLFDYSTTIYNGDFRIVACAINTIKFRKQ